ncbi:hypothetical protein [Candidatus Parabeggiatoa sp. HSG14]|uniref:hypothetical protein n=1 Tax=Candidatus Parabeggiatoa sp. HSG14 TaxID=3055593 RepID=UPI0025A87CDF|nr:hypothetical protein [Thiotrichales bacterium HSG14]
MMNIINNTQDGINGVITGVKKFMAKCEPTTAPFVTLVSSKNKTNAKEISTDLILLLETAEKLRISEGFLCPDVSADTLELAIQHLKDNGVILLAPEDSSFDIAENKVWLN